MVVKGNRRSGASDGPDSGQKPAAGLSLDRLDQALAELPKRVGHGRGRPQTDSGPQALIRQRLDQIEAVIEQGVSISAIAREVGMTPQAFRSYLVRARNQRAGLTQEGKPRMPQPAPGEHWSPGARRALRERQMAEAGLTPQPQRRPEPAQQEAPVRRFSDPADDAPAEPAPEPGKPFRWATASAQQADKERPKGSYYTTPAPSKGAR